MTQKIFSIIEPPAWAKSGLPPPPFPPITSEPILTRLTASIFFESSCVTPTAKPILLSLIA